MSQKTLERLEYLRKSNSNRCWVNNQLYRLMYKEDLYIVAYERMKSKPGNMTAGTDKETLDGFSLETIRAIIHEMRTEQFQFKPVRTTFIPKANGKMRKLGIPCVRDKVVQEVMHMILEAIYDSPHGPYFSDTSHGFRPSRSCHTALREIRGKWTGVNWLVEGDIRACFDEIDHSTLVTILKKKIQDQRFLNLIWKLLNAGYMDLHGSKKESLIGSPQGSLVSPILANIYLHELDEFVAGLQTKREKGKRKRHNLTYHRLSHKKARLVAKGETHTKEFKDTIKRMRGLPTLQVDDPDFIRIKYLRYADDWLIGVCGSYALAEDIKQEIKHFLGETLRLTLSEEKTHITHARTQEALFLGTQLKNGKWRGSEGDVVNQPKGTDVQTPLDGVGNDHESSNTKTHQENERQRILHEGGRTHPEIRMGLPGCRTDSEPVQQRESRHTELLPLRRQLGTIEQSPIHPRILTRQDARAKVPNLYVQSLQTLWQGIYHRHQGKRRQRRPKGQLLPQSGLGQKSGCIPKRKAPRYRSCSNCDAYENALKAGATVLHLRRKCKAHCHAPRSTHSEVIQQTGSDRVQPHLADAEPKTNPSV